MPYLMIQSEDGEIAGIVSVVDDVLIAHQAEIQREFGSCGFTMTVEKTVISADEVDMVVSTTAPMVELRNYMRTLRDPSKE